MSSPLLNKILKILSLLLLTSCAVLTVIAFTRDDFFGEVGPFPEEVGPFPNVYVQCFASVNQFLQLFDTHYESCRHPRQGSLHFSSENSVYFNWSVYPKTYSDGTEVTEMFFENTSYDPKTRTFKGSIVFDKRLAADKWNPEVDKIYQQDYVMIFNKNFTKIFAGQEESLYDDGSKTIRKYNYKNEEVGYRGDDLYYLIDYMSPLYYRLEE